MVVPDAVVDAAAGVSGSIIALLATYPLKTIYTLQALQSDSKQANGILDIVLRYKLSGLYVGIEPNIVESGLSSGVYFFLYNRLRDLAVSRRRAGMGLAASPAQSSSKDQDIGFLASLLVPAIAAVGNQLITMPASVVATRMQALKKSYMDGHSKEAPTVSSIVSSIRSESGIGGFWAGLLPSLVLISNPSIQFMLYEQILRALRAWKRRRLAAQLSKQQQQSTATAAQPVSDNCSRGTSEESTSTATFDHVNANSQRQVLALDDEGVASSSGSSGWRTAEQGSSSWSQRESPRAASANTGKTDQHQQAEAGSEAVAGAGAAQATAQLPPIQLAAWETFLASALSKIGATLATYWLVVVKSRMQAASKSMPEKQYKGTFDALNRIWQEEGMGGFFKGLQAKLLQTALNAALMLMLKEQIYIKIRQLLTAPDLGRRAKHLVMARITSFM